MEENIRISTLNDFVFCPKSIYFHWLYDQYEKQTYQENVQVNWTLAHATIDSWSYSTSSEILQWISIYSEKYWLVGKIDVFHKWKKSLIERKAHISQVFQWQIYQVYAQYFCLTEMWYEVEKMKLYSMDDNKVYEIQIPNEEETKKFENFLKSYREYDPKNDHEKPNIEKCKNCIYSELCDKSAL